MLHYMNKIVVQALSYVQGEGVVMIPFPCYHYMFLGVPLLQHNWIVIQTKTSQGYACQYL